jgi:hypothetical protein
LRGDASNALLLIILLGALTGFLLYNLTQRQFSWVTPESRYWISFGDRR